jgi:hypothetical protein
VARGPWFRERPALAVAVAALLFLGIFCLRLFVGTPTDAYSMLYVLPVALVATAFGAPAGFAAALVGLGLMIVWVASDDVTLTASGWGSRAVPVLLLGVLVGNASDRLRRSDEQRRRLEAAALLHREAIEINDSLVQGMAAAKWSLEAGQLDAGLRTLDDTLTRAHDLVSDLIQRADMGGRAELLDEGDGPA